MTISNERDNRSRFASPLERAFLIDGRQTADDFPDPFGAHDIECWVWDGERLIPASAPEIQDFEEWERSRAASRRLAALERTRHTRIGRARTRLVVVARALRVVRIWRRRGPSERQPTGATYATMTETLRETP
jgi:hypothetical protein